MTNGYDPAFISFLQKVIHMGWGWDARSEICEVYGPCETEPASINLNVSGALPWKVFGRQIGFTGGFQVGSGGATVYFGGATGSLNEASVTYSPSTTNQGTYGAVSACTNRSRGVRRL